MPLLAFVWWQNIIDVEKKDKLGLSEKGTFDTFLVPSPILILNMMENSEIENRQQLLQSQSNGYMRMYS